MESLGVVRQKFAVRFDYPVAFTRGIFSVDNTTLVDCLRAREPHRRHRLFVVVDEGVAQAHPTLSAQLETYVDHHAASMQLVAQPLTLTGGEAIKHEADLVANLHRHLSEHAMDRQSFVVIVGGGAVLDAVGYAAATAHRGLRTVRLPTTVLAQNDAGVGVKNGVNGFGVKNYLGCFHPPFAVLNDFDFLQTLERRDALSGYAEAIKVALLRDPTFFDWMEAHAVALSRLAPEPVAQLVRRCAELHLNHIATSGDPFELGSARPLDFGHWAAHKLESLSGHALRHGEAVAIGILLDCRYSVAAGLLPREVYTRIERLVAALGLPRSHETLFAKVGADYAVLGGLQDFREHLGGELTLTLLRGIGMPVEVNDVHTGHMRQAVESAREAGT